ncbi:hypothetical protein [Asticcacaulis benevestitus]|uniref:DUF4345 domain-containing protein n=1 Tax=Asticcacaulis benevestitus DSM 16100 = ATCC BAA-896 TaxID=1121022 RepID=V4RU11_9CAUL|nr:hypothetical protein [Asticcacaulis benevestitus]ESQ94648.1 hypothetical protein ABENE_00720 [Asticcacaulis benevestitus DSM 16100 = ATCC BAA-896]
MPFKALSILTAALCLVLAVVWFVLPDWILANWHVAYLEGGALVSRRMACLFLALGVILFGLRHLRSRGTQQALGNGIIVACASLIVLGLYERISHHAGNGIFAAIGLESAICLAFLSVGRFSVRDDAELAAQPR